MSARRGAQFVPIGMPTICWKSCTYGRAPNAIDISQGSSTCPSNTNTGPTFLYDDSDTPLLYIISRLSRHAGDTEDVFSTSTPRRLDGGKLTGEGFLWLNWFIDCFYL